jgi:hypothetical protein
MVNTPNRKPLKDWFTLALRILGMWELLYAARYVMSAFDISTGLSRATPDYTFGAAMTHTFAHFFLAAWLLKGAPKIADFFYPEPPADKEISDEKPSSTDTPTI